MATRPFLLSCAFPFALALPVGVMLTAFQLERGRSPAWLGLGLALMAGGIVLLESSCRFLAEVGRAEHVVNPPGAVPLPLRRREALLLQRLLVLGPMANTIGLYGLLMEMGHVHFRVCLHASVGYAAGGGARAGGREATVSVTCPLRKSGYRVSYPGAATRRPGRCARPA